ncbi:MAG: RNA pseudouridine synthase [Marinilabiliales bacterium]|nr:MAG: RNA pseudouridine synthase [Marinilabiliales bacterium]
MLHLHLMESIEKYIIKADDLPVRLLDFCIKNLKKINTRAGIKKALKREEIYLNGKVCGGGRWLNENDIVEIFEPKISNHKSFPLKLKIVFEDDLIAVIEKPAGYEVSGNKFKTIQNALTYNLKPSQKVDRLSRPVPVHRLDYGTSGLLICAKTHTAAFDLSKQFEEKLIHKTYHAIVNGSPSNEGIIKDKINGKTAETHFKKLNTINSLVAGQISLLKLNPLTGRKHQIRIHLSGIGHPIVGDKDYMGNFHLLKGKGLFLAATSVKLLHPEKQVLMEFSMDIPNKFTSLLKREEERFNKLG